ncbi:MHS family MFS transporter [Fulvivirgaceae bacterium PWU4]|uniref:MHS family MFS transporter n=1 Tax=Chryseosolibacter histidini TaxID=2782349 RepID=A0AAP2GMK7_9BACT|nr:MFS transporter [Chryseosolibacter histidini]MBT1701394.1 MHS family MFS transporter [Chryseosolibacter histidini]
MATTTVSPSTDKRKLWFVISASSVGTLIEWYDFYLFGSLATILSAKFFPTGNETVGYLSVLATFAAGFIVRPFGAIVFGRLGDRVGRKYTFLVTLVLMGGSTFAIGLVPGYDTIGIFAPLIVVTLRLLQGLALGGEYGGAATYVAEHAPPGKRGFYTSFIQTTATLGLFVSIGVILGVRQSLGVDEFNDWGWRVPFILSAVLVAVSIYIRLKMQESPLFSKIKAEGKISRNPIKESFGNKENLKLVLLALFGATAGQGVVWYTGQFYAMTFIEKTCQVDFIQTRNIIAIALVIGTPLFIFFGWWSDKIGRKMIMMAGMLLAVLLYRPVYKMMYDLADVKQQQEQVERKTISRTRSTNEQGASVVSSKTTHFFLNGNSVVESSTQVDDAAPAVKKEVQLGDHNYWMMVLLVTLQVVLVTMVYGPIAAFLVELFPTKIRYTSMSLPYHIGNGVFGGLTPFLATALYEASKTEANPGGDPFAGLWYPIAVAGASFLIGMVLLSNKKAEEVME